MSSIATPKCTTGPGINAHLTIGNMLFTIRAQNTAQNRDGWKYTNICFIVWSINVAYFSSWFLLFFLVYSGFFCCITG